MKTWFKAGGLSILTGIPPLVLYAIANSVDLAGALLWMSLNVVPWTAHVLRDDLRAQGQTGRFRHSVATTGIALGGAGGSVLGLFFDLNLIISVVLATFFVSGATALFVKAVPGFRQILVRQYTVGLLASAGLGLMLAGWSIALSQSGASTSSGSAAQDPAENAREKEARDARTRQQEPVVTTVTPPTPDLVESVFGAQGRAGRMDARLNPWTGEVELEMTPWTRPYTEVRYAAGMSYDQMKGAWSRVLERADEANVSVKPVRRTEVPFAIPLSNRLSQNDTIRALGYVKSNDSGGGGSRPILRDDQVYHRFMMSRIRQLRRGEYMIRERKEVVTVGVDPRTATPRLEENVKILVSPYTDGRMCLRFPEISAPIQARGELWHIRRGVQRMTRNPDVRRIGMCIHDVRAGDVVAYIGVVSSPSKEIFADLNVVLRYHDDRRTPSVELLDSSLLDGRLGRHVVPSDTNDR